MKYPQDLEKKGFTLNKAKIYAKGLLAILSTKKQDFSKGIEVIKNKNIHKIALANTKTAPYGMASLQALKKVKLYEKNKNKFVYAESISQTLSYIFTACDIGFVAKSSLYSSKLKEHKEGIHWLEVNRDLYEPINQGIVLLKHAKNNKESKEFYDFILSSEAKNIFKKYGYLVPKEENK